MFGRKCTLYIRVVLPDGTRRYCKPVYARKGELKAGYAFIEKKRLTPVAHTMPDMQMMLASAFGKT
ncbi:MAG: hypothetical protein JWO13_3284 [Acidobacteriales bacterium]|nr:hypothetical protein [Terriglobales bacterium]